MHIVQLHVSKHIRDEKHWQWQMTSARERLSLLTVKHSFIYTALRGATWKQQTKCVTLLVKLRLYKKRYIIAMLS